MGPPQRGLWAAATAYTAEGKTQLGFEPIYIFHVEVRQANLNPGLPVARKGAS